MVRLNQHSSIEWRTDTSKISFGPTSTDALRPALWVQVKRRGFTEDLFSSSHIGDRTVKIALPPWITLSFSKPAQCS